MDSLEKALQIQRSICPPRSILSRYLWDSSIHFYVFYLTIDDVSLCLVSKNSQVLSPTQIPRYLQPRQLDTDETDSLKDSIID